jgi:hypothetical protein
VAERFTAGAEALAQMRVREATVSLLDDLVRPVQNRFGNRQADLLGSFQIDDALKLRRLLHGEIGGFAAVENPIDKIGNTTMTCVKIRPVRNKRCQSR